MERPLYDTGSGVHGNTTNGEAIVQGAARKLRLALSSRSNPKVLADNLPRPGLVGSISHHGDTATLKESDFRVTVNPGVERNIPR